MAATPENVWQGLVRDKGQIHPTGWIRVFQLGAATETAHNIGTGHGRGIIAASPDAVWVANGASKTVMRLDRNLEPTAIAKVRGTPVAIAAGAQATWVLCRNGWLWRISPAAERTEGIARLGSRSRALAATERSIWALREPGELIRIEPTTGELTLQTSIGRGARHLVAGGDSLWATRKRGRRLLQVDADSGAVLAESKAPGQIVCVAARDSDLWIGCRRRRAAKQGWLYRVDPSNLRWAEAETLSGRPRATAADAEAVWVACANRGEREGTIARFDPTGGLETFADSDWPVYDLAVFGDSLLATMGLALATPFDAAGGALHGGGLGEGAGGGGGDGGGGGGGN